jgi:NTE family protein
MFLLAGCAGTTRTVNPPLTQIDPGKPQGFERQGQSQAQSQSLVILAFSGGGTRAAAFPTACSKR